MLKATQRNGRSDMDSAVDWTALGEGIVVRHPAPSTERAWMNAKPSTRSFEHRLFVVGPRFIIAEGAGKG
jgi:hypothetical protein